MFFADRRQAIREMLRNLPAGGHMAVAVWDSLDDTPAYAAQVALVQRVAGERAADAPEGMAHFPTLRSMVGADILGWLPLIGVPLFRGTNPSDPEGHR